MNTVKKEAAKGLTQFDLTKKILNNLSHYDITPTAKLVLLYLTDCYNPKHADVFPKQKTISLKLGISERSVMRAIQELFKAGLILIECKHTNRYILMPNSTSHLSQIDKLSQTESQNVTFVPDNLSPTCIEQKRETKKEQHESGENVYQGDDLILYEYAKKKAKYNVDAFIKAIKENGGDKKIISEYKKKKFYTQRALHSIEETQNLIKKYKCFKINTVSAESCGCSLSQLKKRGTLK